MRGLQPIECVPDNVVHLHVGRLSTAASEFHDVGVKKSTWASFEKVDLAVGPDRLLLLSNLQG